MKLKYSIFIFAALLPLCACRRGPVASAGAVVSIAYTLKVDGKVAETAAPDRPFVFTMGDGSVIEGMQDALANRRKGEVINTIIPPEKAYGQPKPELVKEVPLNSLGSVKANIGDTIIARTPDGRAMPVKIGGLSPTGVIVDFNHQLAGKTLEFEITVVDVKEDKK